VPAPWRLATEPASDKRQQTARIVVRVDSQRGAELTDRGRQGAGQQSTGIDLVGKVPVDLGADRDIGGALDIEIGAHYVWLISGRFVH
jgi:hypothetical protein